MPEHAPETPRFPIGDTSEYVKALQDWFQLFDSASTGKANKATPRNLASFIVFLHEVTDEARARAKKTVPSKQWKSDMKRWRARLKDYTREVYFALGAGEGESTSVVVNTVSGPLLLGIYSEPPPPGVKVDDSGVGILDAATPVTLAHQVDVTEVALADAWSRFASDIVHSAKHTTSELIAKVTKAAKISVGIWFVLSLAGALVLAAGVGTYYALTRERKPKGAKRAA